MWENKEDSAQISDLGGNQIYEWTSMEVSVSLDRQMKPI